MTQPSEGGAQRTEERADSIPSSFEAACERARASIECARAAGLTRMFIELDTTNGDETYTTLKTSVPVVRELVRVFAPAAVQVVLPDAGAAALARRDWADGDTPDLRLVGMEEYESDADDDAVVLVVPRASEVDAMVRVVDGATDLVMMVNPDLVDMGVTGLSLNARQLRAAVIDTFVNTFYLRVFPWGVLYRAFPDDWSVWVDDSAEACGFRRIATMNAKPSMDSIFELLDEEQEGEGGAGDGGNAFSKALTGFRRFLKVYAKG